MKNKILKLTFFLGIIFFMIFNFQINSVHAIIYCNFDSAGTSDYYYSDNYYLYGTHDPLCMGGGVPSAISGPDGGPWHWTCYYKAEDLTMGCSAHYVGPDPIYGACGSANGHGYPATSYIDTWQEQCTGGYLTSFVDNGSSWSWVCDGSSTDANCSALKAVANPVHDVRAVEPSSNLCLYGTASSVILNSDIWYWNCSNNPGVDDIGYIYKTTCGSSHGGIFTLPPSSNLCLHGSPSLVTEDSGNYTWTCTGDDSIPVSCSASNNVRKYYFQESTAQTTVTSSTYQDKVALTFTPKENSRYLIIASWAMKSGWVARSVYGKLIRSSGTPKDFNEIIYRPKDLADWIDGSAIAVESYGASPGPQTYKIQFKGQALDATASIENARIVAIELFDEDVYEQDELRSTTSLTAYQNKKTLTFTPATAGEYIIIATATVDGNSTSYDFLTRLNIDGSLYQSQNIEPYYTGSRYPWVIMKKVNLTAAPHNITIQYASENGAASAGIAHARIIALRANKFQNNFYTENENRTFAGTTAKEKLNLSYTAAEADYVTIAVAGADNDSTSSSAQINLNGRLEIEPQDTSSRGFSFFTLKRISAFLNQAISSSMTYRSTSSTAGIQDARVLALEFHPLLEVAISSTGSQVPNLYNATTNNYVGGAFTFLTNKNSGTIKQIAINEKGTINANLNLSNVKLYYETAVTCTYDGTEALFGSVGSFDSSDKAIVNGLMTVNTSQLCLYVVLDIGIGANTGETIEIEISNPSENINAGHDIVPGTSPVQINGTSTVTANTFMVSYAATAGGSCTPLSRIVASGGTSAAPDCIPDLGYVLTDFTRTSGGGGTLNSATGEVTNVTGSQTIQANFDVFVVNGQCGSAHGSPSYVPPTADLCLEGDPSSVTTNTTTFMWDCMGLGGGTTASCSADQLTRPIPCGTYGDTNSSGLINYYDATYGFSNYLTLPLSRIDVNSNGAGDLNDVSDILNYVNGSSPSFSACSIIVTYTSTAGGSCVPASRTVAYNATSAAPTCTPNVGYSLNNFTRTSGGGGTLNSATGEITNVTGSQTIQANFVDFVDGVCGSDNGKVLSGAPTDPCDQGTMINLLGTYSWQCQGVGMGATVNCLASKITFTDPYTLTADNEKCWYCEYYLDDDGFLQPGELVDGKVNLELKFSLTTLAYTSYKIGIGTNNTTPSMETADWLPLSGGSAIFYGVSVVKEKVDSQPTNNSFYITYANNNTTEKTYYWFVKLNGETTWRLAGSFNTPKKPSPVVRVTSDKSTIVIGSDIQYCTTLPSLDAKTDACYSVCWKGAGDISSYSSLTNPDLWKCSICYDSNGDPILCSIGNGNQFSWSMPSSGFFVGSDVNTANPIYRYTSSIGTDKPGLAIYGSECAAEGETGTAIPLPIWRETN